jgi:ubiquinone/menaquinone biosynthesis C-methylase UbiE
VIDDAGDDPAMEQPEAFLKALRAARAVPAPNPRSATRPPDTRAAWDRIAPGYDRTNTPTQMWLGSEGLHRARLREGMRFLDVAAGSGALSIPAARLGARVLATDQSPVMLELLRARANKEGLDLETRVMDGHALEFADDSFDVTGSQFGVMLFADMPRAIREMARVTRPGGAVLVNAYGDPARIEFLGFFVRAIRSVRPAFEGPPANPPPLEFQLADPARLGHELQAAGLQRVTVETVTETTEFRSGDELWDWVVWSNPLAETMLASLNLTGHDLEAAKTALARLVRERADREGMARLTDPVNIGVGVRSKVTAR